MPIQCLECIVIGKDRDVYPAFKAYWKDGTTFLYDHNWKNPTIYHEARYESKGSSLSSFSKMARNR
jgi:hypothetical protein